MQLLRRRGVDHLGPSFDSWLKKITFYKNSEWAWDRRSCSVYIINSTRKIHNFEFSQFIVVKPSSNASFLFGTLSECSHGLLTRLFISFSSYLKRFSFPSVLLCPSIQICFPLYFIQYGQRNSSTSRAMNFHGRRLPLYWVRCQDVRHTSAIKKFHYLSFYIFYTNFKQKYIHLSLFMFIYSVSTLSHYIKYIKEEISNCCTRYK